MEQANDNAADRPSDSSGGSAVLSIWKWTLGPERRIDMPKGARLLDVQEQHGQPQLWALVNPEEKELEARSFRAYGTGHPIKGAPGQYVGTFQLDHGGLVFHVFESD